MKDYYLDKKAEEDLRNSAKMDEARLNDIIASLNNNGVECTTPERILELAKPDTLYNEIEQAKSEYIATLPKYTPDVIKKRDLHYFDEVVESNAESIRRLADILARNRYTIKKDEERFVFDSDEIDRAATKASKHKFEPYQKEAFELMAKLNDAIQEYREAEERLKLISFLNGFDFPTFTPEGGMGTPVHVDLCKEIVRGGFDESRFAAFVRQGYVCTKEEVASLRKKYKV